MPSDTWIADDLTAPTQRGRRGLVWAGALTGAVLVAAVLFLATTPPRAATTVREPGLHARLDQVDLLPGYSIDTERRRLGPARLALADGRTVFVPARTPYSGADPCPALRLPEDDGDVTCTVFLWVDDEGTGVTWLTLLRPGGPGEGLLVGRLLSGSADQLVLDDGTTVRAGPQLRLSECGDDDLAAVVGRGVVISVDDATGEARQLTCRA